MKEIKSGVITRSFFGSFNCDSQSSVWIKDLTGGILVKRDERSFEIVVIFRAFISMEMEPAQESYETKLFFNISITEINKFKK